MEGTQATGQRRSAGSEDRRPARARPPGAGFRTGPWKADRISPSVATDHDPFGGAGLDQPALVSRLEADVPGSRRFLHGLPIAAGVSPMDQTGRRSLLLRPGSL